MEKYKKSIKLAERITRYLKGDLSEAEMLVLKKSLKESSDGEQLLTKIRDQKNIAAKQVLYDSFDAKKNWEQIRKATGRKVHRRIYRMSWYAAILILPLMVAIPVWYVDRVKEMERPQYIVDAYFERHKTILELPGGQIVDLDTVKNIAKELNEFGVILEEGKGLNYSGIDSIVDNKVEYHRIVVPRGGEYNLKLADGTDVWMFADSEIRFPTRFKGNKREVYLEGEAYFHVTASKEHPFIVKTKDMDVMVTGTEFNVKAYSDEMNVQTTLLQGVVTVFSGFEKKEKMEIKPNQQAEWCRRSVKMRVREVDPDLFMAWKNGRFIFRQDRLEDIMRTLARWYGVEVVYLDESVKSMLFAGKLDRSEEITPILDVLRTTDKLSVDVKGKKIVIGLK